MVHSGYSWGGAPVAMLRVIEALSELDDFSINILLNSSGQVLDKYTKLGYDCTTLPFPTFGGPGGRKPRYRELFLFYFRFIFAFPRLYNYIKKNNFNYIYLNSGINFSLALVCKWLKKPVIWQIREILDDKSVLGRWYCRQISTLAKTVIATSYRVASSIGSDTHIKIIHDSVPDSLLSPVPVQKIMSLKRYWKMEGSFIIGLVAPINWSKGHFVLLEALRIALKTNSNIRIVFIGGTVTPPDYHKTLRSKIKRLLGGYSDAEILLKIKVKEKGLTNYIRFDGWRHGDELKTALYTIDALVFPSIIPEGFGLPVIEAAFSGKPSIAINIGSTPELIQDGYTGWLVPINDSNDLAKSIIEAASHPNETKKMGDQARKIALKRFTSSIHKQKIISLFDQTTS